QRFVEEIGDNPRAREALARSYLRVGEIHGLMGNPNEAVEHMEKGVAICRRLSEEQPKNRAYRGLLALGYEHLGLVHPDRRADQQALAQSLEFREALLEANPQNAAAYRSKLAFNYYNAAYGLGDRDPEGALRCLARARAIREPQAQGKAGVDVLDHLAQIYLLTAALQRGRGRTTEAGDAGHKGIEVYARLAAAHPDEDRFAISLAEAYQELHFTQETAGRHKEAIASLEQACAVLEKLVARETRPGTDMFPAQFALAKAA